MPPEAPAGLGQHLKSLCFDCAQMEESIKKTVAYPKSLGRKNVFAISKKISEYTDISEYTGYYQYILLPWHSLSVKWEYADILTDFCPYVRRFNAQFH